MIATKVVHYRAVIFSGPIFTFFHDVFVLSDDQIGKDIGSEKLSDRKRYHRIGKIYRVGKIIGSEKISDRKIADLPIRYDRKKIGNFRYIRSDPI